jgi:hypothetical protein
MVFLGENLTGIELLFIENLLKAEFKLKWSPF